MPITEKEKNRLIEILGKLNTDLELIRFSGLIYSTFVQAKLPSNALIYIGKQLYAGVPWDKIPNEIRLPLLKATEEFTVKLIPQIYDIIPTENQTTETPQVSTDTSQETSADGLPELPSDFQMEAAHMGGSAGAVTPPAANPTVSQEEKKPEKRKKERLSQQGQPTSPRTSPEETAKSPGATLIEETAISEEDESNNTILDIQNGEIVEVARSGNGEDKERPLKNGGNTNPRTIEPAATKPQE